jgi:hypothetical protein
LVVFQVDCEQTCRQRGDGAGELVVPGAETEEVWQARRAEQWQGGCQVVAQHIQEHQHLQVVQRGGGEASAESAVHEVYGGDIVPGTRQAVPGQRGAAGVRAHGVLCRGGGGGETCEVPVLAAVGAPRGAVGGIEEGMEG